LDNNTISTIANGAFTGLTALTSLYGVGLWGKGFVWFSLFGGCMDAGAFFAGLIGFLLCFAMTC
jgi:hypothetical protein